MGWHDGGREKRRVTLPQTGALTELRYAPKPKCRGALDIPLGPPRQAAGERRSILWLSEHPVAGRDFVDKGTELLIELGSGLAGGRA